MTEEHDPPPITQPLLDAIRYQQADVAHDVLQVGPTTWAIHGFIPLDGDEILAEFGEPDEARAVLDQLELDEAGSASPDDPS